jgi:fatty acyl-CoA reductase
MKIGIPEFYSGKTVLVTGCTGYVGKVVLEKLMRSCPEIKHIYVMVRPKKGVSLLKRLDEIFKYEIFEPYFIANPAMRKGWKTKISPFGGDLLMTGLGMNKEDAEILNKQVNIVINCAASVSFFDPILDAL